ncbi:CBS domain-containing protein [Actinoplanes sp. NPDC026619]|uniref:CBS domain-containing protein n=1 Tax=Actinoplanes sp. NPDC026619 TaxID=3155798 RepID=UPI0034096BF0
MRVVRARDMMSSPVHTVVETASVESAAHLLTTKAVTALPVLDPDGRLVGIVSEGDLLRHRVPADPTAHIHRLPENDPAQRPGIVVEVMSPDPITTRPDADVAEVAETMLAHDVRSMPVLRDGRVVGIHLSGTFADDTEQGIVLVLARPVPGVAAVRIG